MMELLDEITLLQILVGIGSALILIGIIWIWLKVDGLNNCFYDELEKGD